MVYGRFKGKTERFFVKGDGLKAPKSASKKSVQSGSHASRESVFITEPSTDKVGTW
jgi:hypothetical protein